MFCNIFYTCVLKTNIQYIGLSDSDTALYANTCLSLNFQYFSQIYSSSFCEKNQSHALKYIFNKTLQILFCILQHIFKKKKKSQHILIRDKNPLSGYLIPDWSNGRYLMNEHYIRWIYDLGEVKDNNIWRLNIKI